MQLSWEYYLMHHMPERPQKPGSLSEAQQDHLMMKLAPFFGYFNLAYLKKFPHEKMCLMEVPGFFHERVVMFYSPAFCSFCIKYSSCHLNLNSVKFFPFYLLEMYHQDYLSSFLR